MFNSVSRARASLRLFASLRFSEPRPASQSRILHVRRTAPGNHPRYVISLLTAPTVRVSVSCVRILLAAPRSVRADSRRERPRNPSVTGRVLRPRQTSSAGGDFDDSKSMREVNERKKKVGRTRAAAPASGPARIGASYTSRA